MRESKKDKQIDRAFHLVLFLLYVALFVTGIVCFKKVYIDNISKKPKTENLK